MLPSNRPWDTLCPRAHCRRRRNCNLLIRSMLLSQPYIISIVFFRPRQNSMFSQDPTFQRMHAIRLFPKITEIDLGSFKTRFAQRRFASSYGSAYRPHVASAEKRPSDRRDVDPSTREMTSGRRQKSKEDLLFLRDRDADEFNRADLEALFRVSW